MSRVARALLTGLVDYAGLFPPAGLGMTETVVNYARYQRRADSWGLARLIVPVARLGEFEKALAELPAADRERTRWPVSALPGAELQRDRAAVEDFNARRPMGSSVESLEVRVASADQVEAVKATFNDGIEIYCELPLTGDLPVLIAAVKRAGLRAKVRTGGIKAGDIPSPDAVLAFVAGCAAVRLPFKATAGLHHPLRGPAPLTYEVGAPCATMIGYLNLIVTAALLWHGRPEREARAALTNENRDQVRFGIDSIEWAGIRLSAEELEQTRRRFLLAIGSCSFIEPMDEIRLLGLEPEQASLMADRAGNSST